jgi:hypothetical protein
MKADLSVDYKIDPPTAEISARDAMELMRALADVAGKNLELDIPEIGVSR